MTNWSSAICETNGIRMHYSRTGVGKSPLIFLHGLTANGLCWSVSAQTFEEEYDVILPDFRGHGKSSVPDYGYRYDDHADDIIGLINSLGISASILVGHSMGGLVAAVIASRHPELIRGVVLADPTFVSSKQQREIRDSDAADQHRRLLTWSLEELVKDMQARHPQRPLSIIEAIARARLETSMSAFDVLTPPNPDYIQLVSSINVPSLLVIGDAGVVTAELASELQHLNSKLQVVQISDAGHGLIYDQPQRFSASVRSFLHSID